MVQTRRRGAPGTDRPDDIVIFGNWIVKRSDLPPQRRPSR